MYINFAYLKYSSKMWKLPIQEMPLTFYNCRSATFVAILPSKMGLLQHFPDFLPLKYHKLILWSTGLLIVLCISKFMPPLFQINKVIWYHLLGEKGIYRFHSLLKPQSKENLKLFTLKGSNAKRKCSERKVKTVCKNNHAF